MLHDELIGQLGDEKLDRDATILDVVAIRLVFSSDSSGTK